MDASVVIAVFDNAATLPEQLAALAAQDFAASWELVVVDNGSSDNSVEVVQEWSDRLPKLRVLREPQRGQMYARNTGIRAAAAELVLLCDADDVVDSGWISAMHAALDDDDLVGGRLEYDVLNDAASRGSRDLIQTKSLGTPMAGMRFSSSANFGLHRPAFDALGGFDPQMSETDLCWRAQHAGFSLAFAPDAIVHYRLRNTWHDVLRQARGYTRGRESLYAKHRRMGYLDVSPGSRYKVAAYRASRVVTGLPNLLSARRRLRYAREVGRLAGTVRGLADNRFLVGDSRIRHTTDRAVARDRYIERGRQAVRGWFEETDARLFVLVDAAHRSIGIAGDLLEIGVFEGRSAILLGFLQRPGEHVVVVDPFDDVDETGTARWTPSDRLPPTRTAFEEAYLRHHAALPTVWQCPSSDLTADALGAGRFRMLHIDGAHDWTGIDGDLKLAWVLAAPGAIVVIDDVFHPSFPAVSARVWSAVAQRGLTPVALSSRKLYAAFEASQAGAELRRLIVESGLESVTIEVGDADVSVITGDIPDRASAPKRVARAVTPPALYRASSRARRTVGGRR